jgi:hypothetical protein
VKIYLGLCVALIGAFMTEQVYCQNEGALCPDAKRYENRNFTDYGPLRLSIIQGKGFVNRDGRNPGYAVGGACLSLYTEDAHEWIETQIANSEGIFKFEAIKPGRYRLIARAPGLRPANIPLVVAKPDRLQKSQALQLLIDFLVEGTSLDEGSFGELVKPERLTRSSPIHKESK